MSSVAQEKASTRTGGQAVVEALLNHNVQRVYCVPGESYLAVLDALYDVDERIRLISCRHESGAAMMAAAHGHLTGSPGVCFVTRGPGATNASIAIHIARQASLPMVLGVGQVARAKLGREAFQEVDYAAYFGGIAKHVRQVEDPDAIPAAMADSGALLSGSPPPRWMTGSPARRIRLAFAFNFKVAEAPMDWAILLKVMHDPLAAGCQSGFFRYLEI